MALRPETGFIGRDPERRSVRGALASNPVITVVGPPGVGKTRLALEVAREHPRAFVCDLGPARTHLEVLQRVAHVLGTSADTGSLREALQGWRLVVLDNCEQVAEALCGVIDALGGEIPVLLTSRTPVRHPDEQVIDLGPLPVDDAVRLFVQRARAASDRFDPAAHPPAVLAELVRALDGLPLAIEMAAARTRVLSPSQLLARIADPALLRGGAGRWDSLGAAVAWSWDLLGDDQRSVLAQCSVFCGGFDLAAAEAVVVLRPGAPAVLDLLEHLERASLLGTVAVPDLADELRFRQYQCVRDFVAPHRPAGVEERHARHYVDRFAGLAGSTSALPRPDRIRLSLELANLQAVRAGMDPARVLGAALAVSAVAIHTGPAALGVEVLTDSLLTTAEPRLRLLGLERRGALRMRLGGPATDDLEAGRALAHDLGDAVAESAFLSNLGILHRRAGRYSEAEQLYRRAAELVEAGRPALASTVWGNLAALQLSVLGEAARPAVERSLACAERSGDPSSLGWALLRAADLERESDAYSAAEQWIRRALPHAREVGGVLEALALLHAGSIRHLLGRYDEAGEALREAETAAGSVGEASGAAFVWRAQAVLAATTGDLDGARRLATAAMEAHERAGDRAAALRDRLTLALVALEEGRVDDAAARIAALQVEAAGGFLRGQAAVVAIAVSSDPGEAHVATSGLSPTLAGVGEAWLAFRSGDPDGARVLLDALPAVVDEVVGVLRRVLRRQLPDGAEVEPADALRLVVRYESVHIHRPGRPVTVIGGNAARLLTELAQMEAPAPWSLVARGLWGPEVDEVSLRRRWDTTVWRLRGRLRDEGVRSSLVHTDRRGNVELVLGASDVVDDQS